MPQVFKIGSYYVYFWTNENEPLEPVHVDDVLKKWVEYFGEIRYFC